MASKAEYQRICRCGLNDARMKAVQDYLCGYLQASESANGRVEMGPVALVESIAKGCRVMFCKVEGGDACIGIVVRPDSEA